MIDILPEADGAAPAYKSLLIVGEDILSPHKKTRWDFPVLTAHNYSPEGEGGVYATFSWWKTLAYVPRSSDFLIAEVLPTPPYIKGDKGWRASGAVISKVVLFCGRAPAYNLLMHLLDYWQIPHTFSSFPPPEETCFGRGLITNLSFRSLDLTAYDLHAFPLYGRDLSGSKLALCSLSFANLDYAVLYKTNLTKANLTKASLRYADLSEAIVDYALFGQANITGALISEEQLHKIWSVLPKFSRPFPNRAAG